MEKPPHQLLNTPIISNQSKPDHLFGHHLFEKNLTVRNSIKTSIGIYYTFLISGKLELVLKLRTTKSYAKPTRANALSRSP